MRARALVSAPLQYRRMAPEGAHATTDMGERALEYSIALETLNP